jgi:hypothetical protein
MQNCAIALPRRESARDVHAGINDARAAAKPMDRQSPFSGTLLALVRQRPRALVHPQVGHAQ